MLVHHKALDQLLVY